jgi:hypothetical protein
MTGLPAAQPNHSLATAHAPAQVAVWPPDVPAPALVSSRAWARVIRQARCTESSLDADVWFPVSPGAQQARQEAAAAIAICTDCPVRSQCLALSLQHWDVGQHGVWGGMVAAERASLRRQMLAHRADALRYFTDAAGLPSLPLTSPASTTGGREDLFTERVGCTLHSRFLLSLTIADRCGPIVTRAGRLSSELDAVTTPQPVHQRRAEPDQEVVGAFAHADGCYHGRFGELEAADGGDLGTEEGADDLSSSRSRATEVHSRATPHSGCHRGLRRALPLAGNGVFGQLTVPSVALRRAVIAPPR